MKGRHVWGAKVPWLWSVETPPPPHWGAITRHWTSSSRAAPKCLIWEHLTSKGLILCVTGSWVSWVAGGTYILTLTLTVAVQSPSSSTPGWVMIILLTAAPERTRKLWVDYQNHLFWSKLILCLPLNEHYWILLKFLMHKYLNEGIQHEQLHL